MRAVIYPGTFDPITNGHLDVVMRSLKLFDQVIVAVAESVKKNTLFEHKQRIDLVKQTLSNQSNVKVTGFTGLLANFAQEQGVNAIIRGLRALSDFEYEFQLAHMNSKIGNIESIFLVPAPENTFISSSLVKEVAALGGDITNFVPNCVAAKMKN